LQADQGEYANREQQDSDHGLDQNNAALLVASRTAPALRR